MANNDVFQTVYSMGIMGKQNLAVPHSVFSILHILYLLPTYSSLNDDKKVHPKKEVLDNLDLANYDQSLYRSSRTLIYQHQHIQISLQIPHYGLHITDHILHVL